MDTAFITSSKYSQITKMAKYLYTGLMVAMMVSCASIPENPVKRTSPLVRTANITEINIRADIDRLGSVASNVDKDTPISSALVILNAYEESAAINEFSAIGNGFNVTIADKVKEKLKSKLLSMNYVSQMTDGDADLYLVVEITSYGFLFPTDPAKPLVFVRGKMNVNKERNGETIYHSREFEGVGNVAMTVNDWKIKKGLLMEQLDLATGELANNLVWYFSPKDEIHDY